MVDVCTVTAYSSCPYLAVTSAVTAWQAQVATPDCRFQVGDHRVKEFTCHRESLADASPVMAAMLRGNFAEHSAPIIRVPDVAPDAFAAMLRYVYEGGVLLDDFELACELLYASKKYMLPDNLLAQCRACLWARVYPANVWRALRFASNNDEEELYDVAWQLMQMHTSEALLLPDFAEIDEEMLVAVLSEERLSCSELELFQACVRWAQEDPRPLQPLLRHIRILAMPHDDFVQGPASSDMLSPQHKIQLLMFKLNPDKEISLPRDLCSIQEPRKTPCFDSFFVFGTSPTSIAFQDESLPQNQNTYNVFSSFSFPNQGDHVLVLPTQVHEDSGDKYDEDLTVLLFAGGRVLSDTRITRGVHYNSTIEIPCVIECEEHVEQVFCQVVFHKSGRYPLYLAPAMLDKTGVTTYAFNGSANTYDVFEKKFTLMQYLLHNLFQLSSYFFPWSKFSEKYI